jgi:hypothetical protein
MGTVLIATQPYSSMRMDTTMTKMKKTRRKKKRMVNS